MSSRTAGLPGLQHGGGAVAAASARHLHAEAAALMAGWHHGSTDGDGGKAAEVCASCLPSGGAAFGAPELAPHAPRGATVEFQPKATNVFRGSERERLGARSRQAAASSHGDAGNGGRRRDRDRRRPRRLQAGGRSSYYEPALYVGVETTAALAGFVAAYLLFFRFRQNARLDVLLIAVGLAILVASATSSTARFPSRSTARPDVLTTWGLASGHVLGALVLALAAFAPPRRVLRPEAQRVDRRRSTRSSRSGCSPRR